MVEHGKTIKRSGPVRDSYLDLIRAFPLRPIRNRRELDAAVHVIDGLLDKESLDAGEADYLDVLGDLVAAYEADDVPRSNPSDAALLAHLLEARGVTQAEAARQMQIASSTLSAVLAEKRKLTRSHIEKLAEFFHVAPAVFYSGR
ncbi:MAG TPA: helix-turn-helix domain-containing protein [Planctomycetota bacterium]|nr:helix-turn-helix domain-containing protein [Planctomycetota bacterium]